MRPGNFAAAAGAARAPARLMGAILSVLSMPFWVARAGEGRAGAAFDPPVWNYGVRERERLVEREVLVRPAGGPRLRIAHVQHACSCLEVAVTRAEGTSPAPAALSVVMDTERMSGRTEHAVYVAFAEPAGLVARYVVTGWVREPGGRGEVEVFYAAEEEAGRELVEWWRPLAAGATSRAGAADVRLMPIEDLANYRRMRELERKLPREGPAPEVSAYVDGAIALRGMDEVVAGLTGLVNLRDDGRPYPPAGRARAERGAVLPPPPAMGAALGEAPAGAPPPAGALEVRVFHFPACRRCREIRDAARRVAASHAGRVRVSLLDLTEPAVFAACHATRELYADPPVVRPPVIAFVGDVVLDGEDAVAGGLDEAVRGRLRAGGAHLAIPVPGPAPPGPSALEVASFWGVMAAALADSVNPCAFAAMVILVSVLAAPGLATGPSRPVRRVLAGGASFTVGVYAAYFALGVGLMEILTRLSALRAVEAALFWGMVALALAGAALSALDAARWARTRDPGALVLKLPRRLRALVAPVARGRIAGWGLVAGGLASGVAVAAIEGVCTGQMYLPGIYAMVRAPGLRAMGAALLALYNLVFVAPLVVILAAAAAGVHFRRLNEFLRRHVTAAKLLMAAAFAGLAAVMLWGASR